MWQQRWDISVKGRLTYLFIPEVDFIEKNKWFCLNQKINSLITGHGSTNDKLFKLNFQNSSAWPYCNEKETVMHIIFSCPFYEHLRTKQILDMRNGGNIPDVKECINTKDAFIDIRKFIQDVRYQTVVC